MRPNLLENTISTELSGYEVSASGGALRKVIIYRPEADPTWPLAVQLLYDEYSRFEKWLLRDFPKLGLPFEIAHTDEEVMAAVSAESSGSEPCQLLCICFPHQIQVEVACRKIVLLHFFFDTYSTEVSYVLPLETWLDFLAAVDDIIVPSYLIKSSVKSLIDQQTRVHVIEPRIESRSLADRTTAVRY